MAELELFREQSPLDHLLTFDFVRDEGVRAVLESYCQQANACGDENLYLGAIVSAGAVVEGLLTWRLLQTHEKALSSRGAPRRQGQVLKISEWGLRSLIEVSGDIGVLGPVAQQACWALKDFRNLIHPYNLLRQSARPDAALAQSALAALNEVVRSVKGRLSNS